MSKKSHQFLTLWPWPLTYDLEKLIRSGHYHYQCVYQIWEQSIQWFLSYRVNTIAGGGRLWRKTITSPDPSNTGDIIKILVINFSLLIHMWVQFYSILQLSESFGWENLILRESASCYWFASENNAHSCTWSKLTTGWSGSWSQVNSSSTGHQGKGNVIMLTNLSSLEALKAVTLTPSMPPVIASQWPWWLYQFRNLFGKQLPKSISSDGPWRGRVDISLSHWYQNLNCGENMVMWLNLKYLIDKTWIL